MNLILPGIVAFLATVIMTPLVKQIALHVKALDEPNDRKVHKKIIPRLGGLAIYIGFLVAVTLFVDKDANLYGILISSFIVVILGLIDDIKPLGALIKFSGQLLAATVLMVYGNLYIEEISAFGYSLNFGYLTYPVTVFFIVGAINAINIIDGLDGLAAGVSSIFFATIAVIAILLNRVGGNDVLLSVIMLGACLGFLIYNFNPASIFMGDSGSMLLGLIIATISLSGYKNVTFTSLIIPLVLLAIPILDTLFAIIRRVIKRQKISHADKEHLHHQLLNLTNSQRKTVLYIYAFNILFAAISIFYLKKDATLGMISYAIAFLVVLTLIFKTTIIKDFKNKK